MSLSNFFAKQTLKETQSRFSDFVIKNLKAPKYARVFVQYKGETDQQEDIIALYTNENNEQDPNDDKIMFYCNGIEELIPLIVDSKEDFVVLYVVEFLDEI